MTVRWIIGILVFIFATQAFAMSLAPSDTKFINAQVQRIERQITSPADRENALARLDKRIANFRSERLKKIYREIRTKIAQDLRVTSEVKSHLLGSSPLGIGLEGIADYMGGEPFINIFKTCREWDSETPLALSSDGYPLKVWADGLGCYLLTSNDLRTTYMGAGEKPGRFIITWEGTGEVGTWWGWSIASNDQTKKRIEMTVSRAESAEDYRKVVILKTDSRDPIRNIVVVRAEYESHFARGEVFNPIYLERIKKFRSLRFMDWMSTNNSIQKEWADRPKPRDYTYSIKGVPVEVMVQLCNTLQTDCWFNMPHLSSPSYQKQFAEYLRDSLDKKLVAAIEYSNEAWNWQFTQAQYANEEGRKRWGDIGDAWMQWNGMKTDQMCRVFKKVYGGGPTDKITRLNCIIGTQTGWIGLEDGLLDCPEYQKEWNAACSASADSLAITGYMSAAVAANEENTALLRTYLKRSKSYALDKIFQELEFENVFKEEHDGILTAAKNYQYFAKVAALKKLRLQVYEGGQHITANGWPAQDDEAMTDLFISANRDPRMKAIYLKNFANWKAAGGEVFHHFVDISGTSKYGSWGSLESLYQDPKAAPKYQALVDFMDTTPCWWKECTR